MLVTTRRVGEALTVGEDVIVTVLEVRGDRVKLGIDAPREVLIGRPEWTLPAGRLGRDRREDDSAKGDAAGGRQGGSAPEQGDWDPAGGGGG